MTEANLFFYLDQLQLLMHVHQQRRNLGTKCPETLRI